VALPLLALVQLADLGWHPLTREVTLTVNAPVATASAPAASSWMLLWMAYGAVTMWRLLRWARAQFRLRHWLREARPCDAPPWQCLSRPLPAQRAVPVLVHPAAGSPFLLGLRRPRIVIPAYLEHCSEARAQLVLLHELAHWQARDPLRVFVVDLVCCLLWFQPLLQRVRRGFSADIELACDDRVLRAGSDAHDYAETIALCAAQQRLQGAALVGMAMQRSQLVLRVTRILAEPEVPTPAGMRWPLLLVAAASMLLLGVNFSPRVQAIVAAPTPAVASIQLMQPAVDNAVPAIAPLTWPELVAAKPSSESPPARDGASPSAARQPGARSTAAPVAASVAAPTPAPRIDSAQLRQSLSSVALLDGQRYAQEHAGEPLLDSPTTQEHFEQGVAQSRAERSARREKVVRRVMEGLMGTIPLN